MSLHCCSMCLCTVRMCVVCVCITVRVVHDMYIVCVLCVLSVSGL